MNDAGMRNPAFGVPRKTRPVHPVSLTTAPKHPQPEMDHLSAKRSKPIVIARDRVIVEVAANHPLQPAPNVGRMAVQVSQ